MYKGNMCANCVYVADKRLYVNNERIICRRFPIETEKLLEDWCGEHKFDSERYSQKNNSILSV